jgi:glycosyltransferase involved in cell wall biosynthesis
LNKKTPLNNQSFIEILLLASGSISIVYLLAMVLIVALSKKHTTPTPTNEGVSVIIAAHNEYENLKLFLPTVLNQEYPLYEVLVVCDRCTDASIAFLKSINHSALRIIEIPTHTEGLNPKKAALQEAIQQAKYPWILTTDADCYPATNKWINEMMQAKKTKQICLGLSMYQQKFTFLNFFIQFETLFTGIQYSSWAKIGKPYMAVGRNLLYLKELFINNQGFGKHENHLGGDDDLLIQSIAFSSNTTVATNPKSFTVSRPSETYLQWWRQKHRHLHAGKQYPSSILMALGIYPLTSAIFHFLCFYCFFSLNLEVIMTIYILRTCIFISIFAWIGYKWNLRLSIFFLAIAEVTYLIYLLFAGIYNLAVPIKKWK